MPQWDHPPVDMTFEPVEGQTVGPLDFPDLNALVSWVLSDGLAEGEGLPFAHLGDKLAHTISVRP